jgi:hypothetical protein
MKSNRMTGERGDYNRPRSNLYLVGEPFTTNPLGSHNYKTENSQVSESLKPCNTSTNPTSINYTLRSSMNQVVFKNPMVAGAATQKEDVFDSPRKVTNMMIFDQHGFEPMKSDYDTATTCSNSLSSLRIQKRNQDPIQIDKSFRFSDSLVTFAAEPPPPMTDEEKKAAFWKPLEFQLFRQYSKRIVQTLFKSDGNKKLQKVFQICAETEKWDDEWLSTTACTDLSLTPARGLEVVACSQLLAARKKALKLVVSAQNQIPEDETNPAEVLRNVSEALSKPARRLARMLGHSDHAVAQHLHAR